MINKLNIELDKIKLSNENESINIRTSQYHFSLDHHVNKEINIKSIHNVRNGEKYICLSFGSYNVYLSDKEMVKELKEKIDTASKFMQSKSIF